jgi:hypothetical protein
MYWRTKTKESLKSIPSAPLMHDVDHAKVNLLLEIGFGPEDASSEAPPSSKRPASSTKRSAEQASLPRLPSSKKLKTPLAVDISKEALEVNVKVVVVDSDCKHELSDNFNTENEESNDSNAESASKAPHRSRMCMFKMAGLGRGRIR